MLLWSSNPTSLHVRYSIQQCWLFFACMSCSSFHCKSCLCGRAVVTYSNKCSFLPWLLLIFIATGLQVCKFANLHTSIVNLLQMLIYVNLRLRPPSTYTNVCLLLGQLAIKLMLMIKKKPYKFIPKF